MREYRNDNVVATADEHQAEDQGGERREYEVSRRNRVTKPAGWLQYQEVVRSKVAVLVQEMSFFCKYEKWGIQLMS